MMMIPFPPELAAISATSAKMQYEARKGKNTGDHSTQNVACYRMPDGSVKRSYDSYKADYPEGSEPGLGTVHSTLRHYPNDTHGYTMHVTDFSPASELLAESAPWANPSVAYVEAVNGGEGHFIFAANEDELADNLSGEANVIRPPVKLCDGGEAPPETAILLRPHYNPVLYAGSKDAVHAQIMTDLLIDLDNEAAVQSFKNDGHFNIIEVTDQNRETVFTFSDVMANVEKVQEESAQMTVPFPPVVSKISAKNYRLFSDMEMSKPGHDFKQDGIACYKRPDGAVVMADNPQDAYHPDGTTPGLATLHATPHESGRGYAKYLAGFTPASDITADCNPWENITIRFGGEELLDFIENMKSSEEFHKLDMSSIRFQVAKSEEDFKAEMDDIFPHRASVEQCGDGSEPPEVGLLMSPAFRPLVWLGSYENVSDALLVRFPEADIDEDISSPEERFYAVVEGIKANYDQSYYKPFVADSKTMVVLDPEEQDMSLGM